MDNRVSPDDSHHLTQAVCPELEVGTMWRFIVYRVLVTALIEMGVASCGFPGQDWGRSIRSVGKSAVTAPTLQPELCRPKKAEPSARRGR